MPRVNLIIVSALILFGVIIGVYIGLSGFSPLILFAALSIPFVLLTIIKPWVAVCLFLILIPMDNIYLLKGGIPSTMTKLSGLYLIFIIVIIGSYRHIGEAFKIKKTLWILIYALVAMFSVFLSKAPGHSLIYLITLYLLIIAYFALILMIRDVRTLNYALMAFISGSAISALASLVFGFGLETSSINQRSGGLWGDPNEFAALLLVNIVLCVSVVISSKNLLFRAISLVSLVFSSIVFFTTYSRSGFIALSVIAVYSLFKIISGKNRAKKLSIIAPCVIVVLILIYIFIPLDVISRFETLRLIEDETSLRSDKSMYYRYKFYFDIGPKLFIENPLFGVGFRGFLLHSPYGMVSHNSFLEVLTGTGLLGFIPFVLIIYFTFRDLRDIRYSAKTKTNDKTIISYSNAIELGLIVYLIVGLFYTLDINKVFWLLITFSTVLVNIARIQKDNAMRTRY